MPRIYYGPFGSHTETHAEPAGGNTGRFPLGQHLVLPDNRGYRYALNDATVEVAGNLYQTRAETDAHQNVAADVARAIGATVISATLGATAAAIDLYSEGYVATTDATAEGYIYKIARARAAGDAHAAVAASGVLTANLEPGESVQVALVATTSEVSFATNRFQLVIIAPATTLTGSIAGVSPGVAAADRYYWSQVKGPAACLGAGVLIVGNNATSPTAVAGAIGPAAATPIEQVVGKVMIVNADTEYFVCDLDLD